MQLTLPLSYGFSVLSAKGYLPISESIASSAVKTSIDVNAKLIIVCSESGSTARLIAKYRPPSAVHVLTQFESTARQCQGVLKNTDSTVVTSMVDNERIIYESISNLKERGVVATGDTVIIVHGTGNVGGSTNQMKILEA